MTKQNEVERELLTFHAAELSSEGYSVIFEPSAAQLPEELKLLRPDAIAIGKKPYLVLEVTREGKSAERAKEVAQAISKSPDWKLYTIFDFINAPKAIVTSPMALIRTTVLNVASISKSDPRAALLVCWSCLEALARAIQPDNFVKPQTPGRVVEQLASLGYLVSSEADFLRGASKKRNAFIHGDLSVDVSAVEIGNFLELLKSLIGAAERQGHH